MAINYQTPFRLTPEELGGSMPDFQKAFRSGLQTARETADTVYHPKNLAEKLLAMQLENKINKPKAEHAEEITLADLKNTNARTGLIGAQTEAIPSEIANREANTLKQRILNDFLPQREKAEIEEVGAKRDYYKHGGPGTGVGTKAQQAYLANIAADFPEIEDPDVIKQIANAYAAGETQLPDGTQLHPLSPLTKQSLDNMLKTTTTANLINQGIAAEQAEREIEVLSKFAEEGLKPYADTYLGYSPKQILDSTKRDKKSQEQLGKFIGSQALAFEVAQLRIKLANGNTGVTSTQELINHSQQVINAKYPTLSAEARAEANRYINNALKEGSLARRQVGFSPSSLLVPKNNKRTTNSEFSTGEVKTKTINGKNYVWQDNAWHEYGEK